MFGNSIVIISRIFVMMTNMNYTRIKAALQAQRRIIAASPNAASALITSLGIRDILVDATPHKAVTRPKRNKVSAKPAIGQKVNKRAKVKVA